MKEPAAVIIILELGLETVDVEFITDKFVADAVVLLIRVPTIHCETVSWSVKFPAVPLGVMVKL
jgi:hypothetical protein